MSHFFYYYENFGQGQKREGGCQVHSSTFMFANPKRLREFLEQLKTLVNHNACNGPKVHERILDLGYLSGWNFWYLPGTHLIRH